MIELDLQIGLDQAIAPELQRPDSPSPNLPAVNQRALNLRSRSIPARSIPVRGWYLPSTDLAEWIEVLDDCCQKSDCRLYLAPTSVSDIRASGLILLASCTTLPAENHAIKVPLGAIGLIGLGSLSNQIEVWLPYNARLEPNISLSQLVAKLEDSESRTYVWLPSVGLIAFESMDAMEVTQLLRRPSVNENNSNRKWTALPDVEQLPDRIVDFIFPPPKPFEQIFGQEQNEIGSESNQLSTIDDQGNSGGQGVFGKVQQFISDHIERWIKKRELHKQQHSGQESDSANPQQGATGKSLIDRLVSRIAKVNQAERDKQINKLIHLIQTDPDKALRFAIPLAAMSAFRGIGHRSNRLTETTPDFSLPKLFGSGPVDPWAFSQKVQAQLQAAYRMQAERELAAGRFRRAAYIHAHLLGDLTAAAAILERGKAYREAAVIYGEKLNRPRDQARCFALAGVADQAAQIYEELGDYEAAAKTWEEFADFERARLAYRKAVDLKIERFDFLAAAKLLDEKLEDRPAAEELLWAQWPDSQESLSCAELGFRWYAESGRHDLALAKFETLTAMTKKYDRLLLAKLSASLAKQYPDRELRERAEDRCRVVAGAGLRNVSEREMSERLGLIRSLQNDDLLLRRDTTRFENIEKSRSLKLQPEASTERVKLNPLPALRLPQLGEYLSGEMLDGDLFALSRDEQQLYGVRVSMLDEMELRKTYVPLLESDVLGFLKISFIHNRSDRTREIFLSFQRGISEGLGVRELHPPMRGRAWKIVHNPLDVREFHELCGGFGQDGTRWSLSYQFILHGYSSSNLIARELLAPIVDELASGLDFDPYDANSCKMIVVGNTPIVAMGDYLLKYADGKVVSICDLGRKANCMAASPPHTAPRIAIANDESLKVVWLGREDRVETIHDDEIFTHVCFVPGGRLLATTERHLHLYAIYQGNSRPVQRLDRQLLHQEKVVALLSISAEVVGILYENGVLERYRVK